MTDSQRKHGWYLDTRGYQILAGLITLIVALSFLWSSYNASAATTVPTKMHFQGRLTNASGNILANGSYNMRLKLYTVNSGGSAVWSEDRLVSAAQGVTVTNGLFSIKLGDVTSLPASLFASGELYLEVELPTPATATSASPTWSEGPMTPRNQLATSAYAYNAETIDGIDGANIAQLNQNNTFSGNNIFSGTIQGNSSLTLGTTSVAGSLVVNDGSSNTATIQVANLSGNYTYTIPVTTGNDTFCLQTLANCGGAGSGVTTVGALDGGTANSTGATISGTTIYLQSASATNPGLINTSAQTLAGVKTFSSGIVLSANQTISMTGGATASRPGSPTEGMVYYDTSTKQLLTYANGKWQADRSANTKIVAASNSSQAVKDAADYVADGEAIAGPGTIDGDQVQINAALTAAAGGKVYLAEGTYTVDASISIPNNTTIAGAGSGTRITIANGFNANFSAMINTDQTTGTGVTVQDIVLDGNRTNQSGAIGMTGIAFTNMGGGTGTTSRTGSKITNVQSYSWIWSVGGGNSATCQYGSGICLHNSNNNTIVGVTANKNGIAGIRLLSSHHNTITSSNLQGTTNRGIEIESSNYNTVTGNTTEGNDIGINLSTSVGNTVTGNTSANNGSYQIALSVTSDNNTILGNTLTGGSNGLRLTNSSRNNVVGNRIQNSGTSTNNNAIYLDASDSNTITGNQITDTSATTTNYAINIFNSTADTNYLADNTLGTGSIQDLGTGTIYGGQVDATGNYTIQPAGDINLNKNTTVSAGSLTLGNATTAGALIVSDGSSNTATIAVANLAGNYTYTIPVTTANDTFCLQTLANCGGGSGVTTVGALDGGTANANGATISGTTIYLQSASATNAGLVNTTAQTFAGNKTFSGVLTVNNSASFTGTLTVGSGGDTAAISSTGLVLAGNARGTRTVTLVPEFLGSTFRGDGTNNTGSLSSDFCSATTGGLSINTTVCSSANQEHNYYEWANTQATAQDYDIYVRYQIPSNYSTGSMTNLRFTGHGNTNGEAATLTMYQGSTQCATTGDVVTAAGWATGTVASPLGSCTFAANGYVTFKIQLSATQNNQARAGAIEFTYRSTF